MPRHRLLTLKIVAMVSVVLVLVLHIGCIRQAWTLSQLRQAGYRVRIYAPGARQTDGGDVRLEMAAGLIEPATAWEFLADLYGTPATVALHGRWTSAGVDQVNLLRLASLQAKIVQLIEMPDVDDSVAEVLASSQRTREILLMGTEITNRSASRLLSMPALVSLVIDSEKVDDELAVPQLSCGEPISINLWHTSVGDQVVTRLLATRDITDLTVTWTKVSDDCAEALSKEPSLRSVFIGGSLMSGKSVAVIAGNANLEQLWLETLPIDDHAALAISQMPKLRSLLARSSNISEESLATILSNSALQSVMIQSSGISAEFIERVKSQYPHVHIVLGEKPTNL